MRVIATVVVLIGTLSAPHRAAIAQAPASSVDSAIAVIPANTRLRVLTREFQPVGYRLATKRTTGLALHMPERETPLNSSEIDSLWVHVNMTKKASGIGAVVLGVGFAISSASSPLCDAVFCFENRTQAAMFGGAWGVLVGSAIGAVIGASLDTWHLHYGRKESFDGLPPSSRR